MRRRAPKEDEQVEKFPMTPMIDIVFQMIIFFILVLDFIKAVIEPVKLPTATELKDTSYADQTMLVINVMKDGTHKINGRTFFDPKQATTPDQERMAFTKLEELFNRRRHMARYQEVPGRADTVRYFMLIRADRSSAFEHIHRLLMMATRYGGVTKVMFAVEHERS